MKAITISLLVIIGVMVGTVILGLAIIALMILADILAQPLREND